MSIKLTIVSFIVMNKRSILAVPLAIFLLVGVGLAISSQSAYAHTFSGDESADFLAMVEEMKSELQLVKSNLATNATLSAEHVEHALEHLTNDTIKEITERNERLGRDLPASLTTLQETIESGNATASEVDTQISAVNDLIAETQSVRIERAQLTNATVQALVLANIVNEAVEHYNAAYGIEEEEHDEGGHNEETASNSTEDNSTMQMGENEATMDNMTDDEHTTITSMADYQSAQGYAATAQAFFNAKLKAMADANATQSISALEAGLQKFKAAIDNKEPHDEVEMISHTDVHPHLQEAFNLQVVPEFPLPILAALVGIGTVVAYSRIRRNQGGIA